MAQSICIVKTLHALIVIFHCLKLSPVCSLSIVPLEPVSYTHLNLKQALEGKRGKDYKTLLQEFVQRDGDKHIVYSLISESGPDHAKTFMMEVSIDGITYEAGTGKRDVYKRQD